MGKTQHLQTVFMADSTAPKAPYNFLQQPREVTEQRFKWFFATAVSNSDQMGEEKVIIMCSEELCWFSNTPHSLLS